MANSSEKKAQQLYQWYIKTYISILIGLYSFYFIFRIFFGWETWTFGHMFGFLILTIINVVGIKFLFSYLALGHPRTSYGLLEEVLWVNWFIMFVSVFTGYAFLLFLAIPGYLLYAYGPMVKGFFDQRSQQQQQYQQMMNKQQEPVVQKKYR